MRVSTLPVTDGEKVVIRVVDQHARTGRARRPRPAADDLGDRQALSSTGRRASCWSPGPTGSGKTTLLYSALRHIQHVTKNIVTVEDPVEFQLRRHQPGAGRREGEEDLRRRAARHPAPGPGRHHDRRDPRQARPRRSRSAPRSPATWCCRTVHTNDAAGAVTRLVDLGLEPFMVASSLLVRRERCGSCARCARSARSRTSDARANCATSASTVAGEEPLVVSGPRLRALPRLGLLRTHRASSRCSRSTTRSAR